MLTVDANLWIAATEPSDRFHAVSRAFLASAVQQKHAFYLPSIAWIEVGSRLRIRGADALDAAVALRYGAQLRSWDRELVERAGAVTPLAWLAGQH